MPQLSTPTHFIPQSRSSSNETKEINSNTLIIAPFNTTNTTNPPQIPTSKAPQTPSDPSHKPSSPHLHKTLNWVPFNLGKSELSLPLTFPTGQTFRFLGEVEGFEFHEFPSLERLVDVLEEQLRAAGFGYRGHQSSLRFARPGVGPKVAACIALFSLDQHHAIPVYINFNYCDITDCHQIPLARACRHPTDIQAMQSGSRGICNGIWEVRRLGSDSSFHCGTVKALIQSQLQLWNDK
ncbi:N-glycosylase/DNA lyase OGG1-like protein, partial [Drosera capensis]